MLGRSSARPKVSDLSGYATAERASLAIAIAAHTAAMDNETHVRGAMTNLDEQRLAASRAAMTAEHEIKRATEDGPAYTVAMLTGSPWEGEPVTPLPEARAAFEAAEAECHHLRGASDLLKPQVEIARSSVNLAARRCHEARLAVVGVEAARTAAKVAETVLRLRTELADQTALLRLMITAGAFPMTGSGIGPIPQDNHLREAASNTALTIPPPEQSVACAPWLAALARLAEDANAPLPGEA